MKNILARGGIDFSSGGIVDYVAEQNQENDTALTHLTNWPNLHKCLGFNKFLKQLW